MTNEITIKVTNRFSIITICKYDFYQSSKSESNQQNNNESTTVATNHQPTTNQQLTTNNKNKNNKEEEDNRGKGDLASPQTPPKVESVFKAADGSLVKVPTIEYKASDFNGLPDSYAMIIANNIRTVKQVEVAKERLTEAWESFKALEIQKKLYRNKEDVYSFFANYCKRQTWAKSKEDKTDVAKPIKKEKVVGVEFINDFQDCKMNDGTIKKLTINQSDSARYNQINPNSIIK
jgi:hypothetical protein